MEVIKSISQLKSLVDAIRNLRQGMVSNYFSNQTIENDFIEDGLYYYIEYPQCLFILRQDRTCYHTYYVSTDVASLATGLDNLIKDVNQRIVIDVVGFQDAIASQCELMIAKGFQHYRSLYRMSKIGGQKYDYTWDAGLRLATQNDVDSIFVLLQDQFDEYSELVPLKKELIRIIAQGGIIVYEQEGRIIGFVLFEHTKSTFYWRYWYVDSAYREQHIGSKMYHAMLQMASEARRHMLWVLGDNENAIKRHAHFGYIAEKLLDEIYIIN